MKFKCVIKNIYIKKDDYDSNKNNKVFTNESYAYVDTITNKISGHMYDPKDMGKLHDKKTHIINELAVFGLYDVKKLIFSYITLNNKDFPICPECYQYVLYKNKCYLCGD